MSVSTSFCEDAKNARKAKSEIGKRGVVLQDFHPCVLVPQLFLSHIFHSCIFDCPGFSFLMFVGVFFLCIVFVVNISTSHKITRV